MLAASAAYTPNRSDELPRRQTSLTKAIWLTVEYRIGMGIIDAAIVYLFTKRVILSLGIGSAQSIVKFIVMPLWLKYRATK
jgi:hypothetical protein